MRIKTRKETDSEKQINKGGSDQQFLKGKIGKDGKRIVFDYYSRKG